MPAEHPFFEDLKIALAARAAACLNTALTSLTRKIVPRPPYAERRRRGQPGRCLYAVWHCHIWDGMDALKGQGVLAMVSQHRDGEIIARILSRKGFKLLRGSSTRGGAQALRDMVRAVRDDEGDIVVTVDGPKGPAGVVKDGILFAASRTGLPIVPMAVWAERCWRAGSWDRMVIAKPGTRVAIVFGEEIRLPPDAERSALGGSYAGKEADGIQAAEDEARLVLRAARQRGPLTRPHP
jgi:lysophospholipid acyltransferase (LPLAT)-like uncharacterized protein